MDKYPESNDQLSPAAILEQVALERGGELYRSVYKYTGGDAALVKDVIQEAYAKFLNFCKNGNEVCHPYAWIRTAAVNYALDCLRRKGNKDTSLDNDGASYVSAQEGRHVVVDQVITNEMITDLDRCLKYELNEGQLEVFILRTFMKWPAKRVAETLEISHSAVDMRYSRARKKVRQALEEHSLMN